MEDSEEWYPSGNFYVSCIVRYYTEPTVIDGYRRWRERFLITGVHAEYRQLRLHSNSRDKIVIIGVEELGWGSQNFHVDIKGQPVKREWIVTSCSTERKNHYGIPHINPEINYEISYDDKIGLYYYRTIEVARGLYAVGEHYIKYGPIRPENIMFRKTNGDMRKYPLIQEKSE